MTATTLADKTRDTFDAAKQGAAGAAHATAEDVQDRIVDETQASADAADRAADAFEPGSLQAAALSQIAQSLAGASQHLNQKSIEGLADDVAVFARQNPLLFLGGAAVAGFAAARFLKASPTGTRRDAHDPWSNHLGDQDRGAS